MPDWVLQILGWLVGGGIAYGAIRSDLKSLHEGLRDTKAATQRAHVRIDDHIDRHHVRGGQ